MFHSNYHEINMFKKSWLSLRSFFVNIKSNEMVLMKYFCFYFPVRLGVLITSISSFLEALVFCTYCLMYDSQHFKHMVQHIQENIDDYSTNKEFDMFLDFADNCETFSQYFESSRIISFFNVTYRYEWVSPGSYNLLLCFYDCLRAERCCGVENMAFSNRSVHFDGLHSALRHSSLSHHFNDDF